MISFSLWGGNPKYTIGAIRNADLADEIYPGWICKFFIGASTPRDIIDELCHRNNTEVVVMDSPCDWRSTFWRFYPASDPKVDVMISRDTDSRLSLREKRAVEEWLKSGKGFHIMRDYPYHDFKILAGMFGARKGSVPEMAGLADNYLLRHNNNVKEADQNFLKDCVYPIIKNNCMVHDEFFEHKPFPTKRKGYEFVGQIFDENDIPAQFGIGVLRREFSLKSKIRKFLNGLIPKNWTKTRKVIKGMKTFARHVIKPI